MATETAARSPTASRATPAGWSVVLLGWLVPGLGYAMLRKWVRAGLVCGCVLGMFLLGLGLRGEVYGFNTGDVLQMLGFVGDLCAGIPYFAVRGLGGGAGDPFSAMGNYGTIFLIVAGLLNLLAATDARDIALGRKR